MNKKPEIKDLKIYTNEEGVVETNWKTVSAIIDGKQHCTGDVRNIRDKHYAVFSNITEDTGPASLWGSIDSCVQADIYKAIPIKGKLAQVDHYTWVEVDLSEINIK